MKKVISIIFIGLGVMFILYPKVTEYYYDYKRQLIMNELQNNYFEKDDKNQNTNYDNIKKANEIKNNTSVTQNEDTTASSKLIIDKINLEQPILIGASQENLKVSIASINKNIKPGDIGNYAIAGHRSHTYGRNFNRLDELELNDKIKVFYNKKEYIYIITEKFVVKPDKIDVLEGNNKDRELTLITCEPMINPTHRLVIKGNLIE